MSYDNEAPGSAGDARASWPTSASEYEVVLVDRPAPHVNRVTMNRPEKRNALNHKLRAEVLQDFLVVHQQHVVSAQCLAHPRCQRRGLGLRRQPLA